VRGRRAERHRPPVPLHLQGPEHIYPQLAAPCRYAEQPRPVGLGQPQRGGQAVQRAGTRAADPALLDVAQRAYREPAAPGQLILGEVGAPAVLLHEGAETRLGCGRVVGRHLGRTSKAALACHVLPPS
jgi:hypothetical protein